MKSLLPFTILFLSLQANAVGLNDILKGISSPLTTNPENQCVEEDQDFLYQCAIDLCGQPEHSSTASINDANFDKYVQPEVKEKFPEIEEPVREIHSKKKENIENLLKVMKEKLEKPESLLNFGEWNENSYNSLSRDLYEMYIRSEIDKKRPKEERIKYSVNPPENATPEFLKGLEDYVKSKKNKIENSVTEGLYRDFYTNEEGIELLKKLARKFYAEYSVQVMKKPDILMEESQNIEKFRELEKLHFDSGFEIGNAYHTLEYMYSTLLSKAGKKYEKEEFKECEEGCQKGIRSYVTSLNLKDKVKQLEKSLNDKTLQDSLEACQAELIEKSLKQSDKESFLEHYPGIKKNFMEKVFKDYSDHSKKAFNTYMDYEVNLSFINGDPDEVEDFIRNLKDSASSESIREYGKLTSPDLISDFLRHRDWGDPETFDPALTYCMGSPFAAWDAFAPKEFMEDGDFIHDMDKDKDNIMVSLFTCTHGPEGKGVFSHEMGHALSYAFTKGKLSKQSEIAYNRVRNCTTNLYLKPLKAEEGFLTRKGDSLRTEEDMADAISFLATNDDPKIFTCALLETNKEGTKYKDLSLPNKFKMDSHSSPMLRIVREAIYKKKAFTPSCKTIIEKNTDQFRFKPCL